jgi:hypothetical protein
VAMEARFCILTSYENAISVKILRRVETVSYGHSLDRSFVNSLASVGNCFPVFEEAMSIEIGLRF